MNGKPLVVTLAALFIASAASAQTSQCMSMGGGMTHCDHLGGGWTDCNSVGPNMATCHTMGVPETSQAQSSNGGAAEGFGSFVASLRERSFRKKVGTMLAAGDCAGAAKYAFVNGRIELGTEIQKSCQPAVSGPAAAPAIAPAIPLPQFLQQIADRAPIPGVLDANTTITRIHANGSLLTFSILVRDKAQFTDRWRMSLVHQYCDSSGLGRLLTQGATVRSEFEDQQHIALGVITVGAAQCR